MGVRADGRHQLLGKRVLDSVSARHDRVIGINSLVQVLSYVLQARSGLPKTTGTGEWLEEEPACSRRTPRSLCGTSPTTAKLLGSANIGVHAGENGTQCPHLFICRVATAA